jgi:hypothetical protein
MFSNPPKYDYSDREMQILENFKRAEPDAKSVVRARINRISEVCLDETAKAALNYFMEEKWEAFYQEFALASARFTREDFDSIGTSQPSVQVTRLMHCFYTLDQNGLDFVNGRRINFWSGQKAKQQALNATSLSDSQIPAVCVGFDICRCIQKIENCNKQLILARFLPNVISAIFASQAKGEVEVFISSDKFSETASLTAGNNFWNSELPVLQALCQQHILKRISVYLKNSNDDWSSPIDFNSKESNKIPVVRRLPYQIGSPILDDKDPSCFVQIERWKNPELFPTWCQNAKARPNITLGSLRRIARQWRKNSQRKCSL